MTILAASVFEISGGKTKRDKQTPVKILPPTPQLLRA